MNTPEGIERMVDEIDRINDKPDRERSLSVRGAMGRLAVHGPDRVLIPDGDGTLGVRTAQARERNIQWRYVLIRDDGWTLAPAVGLESEARRLFPNWIAFCEWWNTGPAPARPMIEWDARA